MRRTLVLTAAAMVTFCTLLAGCDWRSRPPRHSIFRPIRTATVPPNSSAERDRVTALQTARVNYAYRLSVLSAYYEHVGNMDKYNWSRREVRNLEKAHTFEWEGVPEVVAPKGESVEGADERMLVEYLVIARNTYLKALDETIAFYETGGYDLKLRLTTNIRNRFDPVRTYVYYLGAETPQGQVRPTRVIPEAEAMFAEAYRLFRRGKGLVPLFTTSYPKERRALVLFRELIAKYPQSTKVALSAYYMADIYKEYFNEDVRAVFWYRHAWQWDPDITEPARFQAATVYDIRLQNYSKALEYYKLAIQHEQFNASNVRFAHQRIEDLTRRQEEQ